MNQKFKMMLPWVVAIIVLITIGIVLLLLIRNQEAFHFQVTPAKRCSLGPYLTQSGPNHELCKKMWSSQQGREKIGEIIHVDGNRYRQRTYRTQ